MHKRHGEILSYKDAIHKLKEVMALKKNIIFRGQKDSDWRLQSTFLRLSTEKNWDSQQREIYLNKLLMGFKNEAIRQNLITDNGFTENGQLDELKLLIYAQHYGLPTNLLDWTWSPYVALFFAFNGNSKERIANKRAAVWCFDWNEFRKGAIRLGKRALGKDKIKDEIALKHFNTERTLAITLEIDQVPGNVRFLRQRGVFTRGIYEIYDKTTESLNDYIKRHEDVFHENTLVKITVDTNDQSEAIEDLRMMGLDAAYLMANLDYVSIAVLNNTTKFLEPEFNLS